MKLKFGMVGGGKGSFIGAFHRSGAIMDNLAELSAGCFSRNWDNNQATASAWGIVDGSRIYPDYETMASSEGKRVDKIDFVTIVTPNNSHYSIAKAFMLQGIHVVCDKPLTLTVAEALELESIAQSQNLLFGVTYTYAGYAIIKEARHLIDSGALGKLLTIRAEFPQEWFIVAQKTGKSEQSTWRLDQSQAGESGCTADMCTHLEHLVAAITGLHPESVLAQFDYFPNTHPLENNATILAKYPDGVSGVLWASQIATGHEFDLKVEIFGEKGSIVWTHRDNNAITVTYVNEPPQYITIGRSYTCIESQRLMRAVSGAPVGFSEAFGNIYRSFCMNLIGLKAGTDQASYTYPTVSDGVYGMKFIHASLKSHRSGNIWVSL
ncbi:MAG: Gfo/Idh/MocA family oxidoreductase [Eubacteriales bacterium]|nr:Gfo/Idh/MocA family oxidoreductase [Eubacteriales bacterium]